MRKWILLSLIMTVNLLGAQVSIHSIQYTTNSVDGTYPSELKGQRLQTGGIVTANHYDGNRFFISASQGGPWNGIFVYENGYFPEIGDSVLLTGQVYEYQGYTELKDLSAFEVISSNNPLPPPTVISTGKTTDEAYEGVLIQLNDCAVSSAFDPYGNWQVNDGSGASEISTGIFDLKNDGFPLQQNYAFSRIIGVIGINYGAKKVHPRSIQDLQSAEGEFLVSTSERIIVDPQTFNLPVKISTLNRSGAIDSYAFQITYDPAVLEYSGYNVVDALSQAGSVTDASVPGKVDLSFAGSATFDNEAVLVYLQFVPLNYGDARIGFEQLEINGAANPFASAGDILHQSSLCDIAMADTLTVVQRPLLNIPSIALPAEEIQLECFAPSDETVWTAELLFQELSVPMELTQQNFDAVLEKWILSVRIPQVELYELYDLRVTTSSGLVDTVRNAVRVLDRYKEEYYFAHITDTHLPNHKFYGDDGYKIDSSEMEDLYEVIKDLNLLQPEFVLLTGDLINEGELEDFECLRNHSLTMRLLEKFEVPVYIVPGNHDLGGWNDTPPPQGTARREWWRFFGWRQRTIPPSNVEYLTHDYSFDYGNTHFVGLEAYDNYDSYMYDIYGGESFISSQMAWLENDLASAGDKSKVLFYHYDFKGELNLDALGVDMALWGHNHRNTGDLSAYPASLSTKSVCDGNRSYRIVRVNNGSLQAEQTVHSHMITDMVTLDYDQPNDGTNQKLTATVGNLHGLDFNHALVKFEMPLSDFGYSVTNGVLKQILQKSDRAICYVEVPLASNSQVEVTVEKKLTSGLDRALIQQAKTYPNPFKGQTRIDFTLPKEGAVTVTIYNASGQRIRLLLDETLGAGSFSATWDATNAAGAKVEQGSYLYTIELNGKQAASGRLFYLGE